jgi:hypothetical protein
MANYDILSFLEYYADRASVVSGGLRTPTNQWQNFYQEPQDLSIDTEVGGDYLYLPFDIDGFGSSDAAAVNDLSIELAATGTIVDITDTAMGADNLIIASLYIQNAGQNAFDASSAQLISRYIGSIEAAELTEDAVAWTVNPAIDKLKAQVPTRKVTESMLSKRIKV